MQCVTASFLCTRPLPKTARAVSSGTRAHCTIVAEMTGASWQRPSTLSRPPTRDTASSQHQHRWVGTVTAPVIYLAARYSRAAEMRRYRDQLRALGYLVSSRWIDHHGGVLTESLDSDEISANLQYAQAIAHADLTDLDAANIVIAFTEENG